MNVNTGFAFIFSSRRRRSFWGAVAPYFCNALFACLVMAQAPVQDHPLRTVKFAAGNTSASFAQDLERGAADVYRFDAKEGQLAEIEITSTENNASFVIYLPPSTAAPSADGSGYDVSGAVLMGGDQTEPPLDAGAQKRWRGKLPATGTYYIEIATDRGNASYRLSVGIK